MQAPTESALLVTKVFLFFLMLRNLVEAYLDQRNKNYILSHRNQVPAPFLSSISLDEHQKAALYSVTKIQANHLFRLYDLVIFLGWTLGGGLQALHNMASRLDLGSIGQGVAFFALFGFCSLILGLPQSIYSTFVIEERFGFNKTTPKLFIADLIKGVLVGGLIGMPIFAALLWFMQTTGTGWWFYAWLFLLVVQLIMIWAYPTFIAPLFNKFTPMEEGPTKDKVLQLLERTGFYSKGLFVMDASRRSAHGNAYFTGFGKSKRIVFFDNLIKTLDPDEVEAVLAHELGHFKRKHIIKGMVKSFIFSLIGFAVLGFLAQWEPFFIGHGVESQTGASTLILFSMVAGVYTFFLTPLSAKVSRKYEFEADHFASQNSDAKSLIQALTKLYRDNASTLTPDPMYSAFYHSHPPALQRVEHLQKLAGPTA